MLQLRIARGRRDDEIHARASAFGQEAFDPTMRTFAAPGGVSGVLDVCRAIFKTQSQTELFMRNKVRVSVLALERDTSFGDKTRELQTPVVENVQCGVVPNCGKGAALPADGVFMPPRFRADGGCQRVANTGGRSASPSPAQ